MKYRDYRKIVYDKIDPKIRSLVRSSDMNNVTLGLMFSHSELTEEEFIFFCSDELNLGIAEIDSCDRNYLVNSLIDDYPGIMVICKRLSRTNYNLRPDHIEYATKILKHPFAHAGNLALEMFDVCIRHYVTLSKEDTLLLVDSGQILWSSFYRYLNRLNNPLIDSFTSEDWVKLLMRLTGYAPVDFLKYVINAIIDLNSANVDTLKQFFHNFSLLANSKVREKVFEMLKYSSYSRKNIRKFKKLLEKCIKEEKNRVHTNIHPLNYTKKSKRKIWFEQAIDYKPLLKWNQTLPKCKSHINSYRRDGMFIIRIC